MASGLFLDPANCVTMGRLVAVPALMIILLFVDDNRAGPTDRTLSFVAAIVFTAAMISDIVDGYLARRHASRSRLAIVFGKLSDPLADKVLFLVAMVMMIPLGRIPAWVVSLFLIRGVGVTALRGIAAGEGMVIAASRWGKYKSAFITCATVGLLMHYPFFGINWRMAAWVVLVPALFFSLYSGLHYTVGFVRAVSNPRRSA
jgi:CDP-diacylglycerol--glycerol-3-phosphate 3-phosphatidyltransferase